MRIVVLKDIKIANASYQRLQNDFRTLMQENGGITPEYFTHDVDFKGYPVEPDSDGDMRPTVAFLKEQTDFVYNKYGKWGTDHVVILIDERNWKSGRIWGTNWSNVYHGYHVHYCRFDYDNPANALGTLYHENHHSWDALTLTTTGKDIRPLVNVSHWDRECTHGATDPWQYIRYKENLQSISVSAPYLKEAYEKRKSFFLRDVGLMMQIVLLLQQMLVLLKEQVYKKDGVNKMSMNPSKKYTLNREDLLQVAKVVLYSGASAMLAVVIAFLAEVQVPEQWVFVVPLINSIVVLVKKFVDGKL